MPDSQTIAKKCHLCKQNARLFERNFFFFFLIVYYQDYQACAKVRLFVGFEFFKAIFQRKKQSITMFHCLRLGTTLLVKQYYPEI